MSFSVCPTSISVEPDGGAIVYGTSFTCKVDVVNPKPNFTWHESVSGQTGTGDTFTMSSNDFSYNLTCVATVDNIPGCSLDASVSGNTIQVSAIILAINLRL